MKRVHAFDIDGTVTNQNRLVECVAREFEGFTLEHLTNYYITDSLLEHGFIQKKEEFSEEKFFERYADEIFLGSEVNEGFLDYLSSIRNEKICYITARHIENEHLTEKLFNRLGIPYRNVYHGVKDKSILARELGVTDFYEDSPKNALNVADNSDVHRVWLMDYPYTAGIEHSKIKRIHSWKELLR